ncbi:MAG: four helix bundle protein [Gemmatimonadetes bacterium]|nr:four helix bundle protein [Gemmatimonadota bacterium]
MQNPKNLRITARARELALLIYRVTQALPKEERYGLTSQMRRAVVSIGSNIAEGCGRQADASLAPFLHYALGSANELEFQLVLATDLEFLSATSAIPVQEKIIELRKMLTLLLLSLKKSGRYRASRRAIDASDCAATD